LPSFFALSFTLSSRTALFADVLRDLLLLFGFASDPP
jgi:hypothetical protein